MEEPNKKEGRPAVTQEEKEDIVRKLRPYLQAGLSIRKACLEAKVPKSTVYDLINEDEDFADKIRQGQQYLSILTANTVTSQIHKIAKKQTDGIALTRDELDFVKWFATNSNMTREEFGERKDISVYDPEVEVQRLLGLINEATEGDKDAST